MTIITRRAFSAPLAAVILLSAIGCTTMNRPTGTVEKKYFAAGPWAVTYKPSGECCDTNNNAFDLYYPTNLGANGFQHPIITWANGTSTLPVGYDYFLRHLASWGFFVVATRDPNTGTGATVLEAAAHMAKLSNQATGTYAGKLDVHHIGAAGHSQGATGAINAMKNSGGTIQTVIPIELPSQIWCSSIANCVDTSTLVAGSIFFVDGSADFISPPLQPPGVPKEQSIAAYYDAVPPPLIKAKGTLVGPNHADILGQPDCSAVAFGCTYGVYGYLGYPTAWLMDQLQGDAYAHKAFVKPAGEFFFQISNWLFVDSNVR
jgi:hypothetical protein